MTMPALIMGMAEKIRAKNVDVFIMKFVVMIWLLFVREGVVSWCERMKVIYGRTK